MRRQLFAIASPVLATLLLALETGASGDAFARAALANLVVVTWSSFVPALVSIAALRGEGGRAAWMVVLDLPMNLYPVLLQRDHRLRLAEHLRRGDLASAAGAEQVSRLAAHAGR